MEDTVSVRGSKHRATRFLWRILFPSCVMWHALTCSSPWASSCCSLWWLYSSPPITRWFNLDADTLISHFSSLLTRCRWHRRARRAAAPQLSSTRLRSPVAAPPLHLQTASHSLMSQLSSHPTRAAFKVTGLPHMFCCGTSSLHTHANTQDTRSPVAFWFWFAATPGAKLRLSSCLQGCRHLTLCHGHHRWRWRFIRVFFLLRSETTLLLILINTNVILTQLHPEHRGFRNKPFTLSEGQLITAYRAFTADWSANRAIQSNHRKHFCKSVLQTVVPERLTSAAVERLLTCTINDRFSEEISDFWDSCLRLCQAIPFLRIANRELLCRNLTRNAATHAAICQESVFFY